MNDLKHGILDVNGFLLGPETSMEDVSRFFGIKPNENCSNSFDLSHYRFVNNNQTFQFVNVWFDDDTKKLSFVSISPVLPDIAAKYDLSDYSKDWLPYYREVRAILDAWLEKQLGEATYKDADCTEYKTENLLIATASYEEFQRDYHVEGGKLEIYYK